MDTELWSREIALAAEPVSVSKVRDFVCECLVDHRLLDLVEDMRLVASELATNAIRHARTGFTARVHREGGSVFLTLRAGSDWVPLEGDAAQPDETGRGLVIVGLLSSGWGVTTADDGAKEVWASFPIRSRVRSDEQRWPLRGSHDEVTASAGDDEARLSR